jgi:hydroxyacylglutathione hydrolase/adenylyltransferase/sulfurtransferase
MSAGPDDGLEVTTEHTASAIDDGSALLVDVRESYELVSGRLAGSLHVELGRLPTEADTIDRDRPVIFYCHSGVRSLMAAQAFRQAGFDAWSMAGGIERWEQEGRPLS